MMVARTLRKFLQECTYLQGYGKKHQVKGNRSAWAWLLQTALCATRPPYYKDGSEVLVWREGINPPRLTPRECTRLTGFPDTFRISVSDTRL
jgi:DNA (cytosine-5)-methyltransferase 1